MIIHPLMAAGARRPWRAALLGGAALLLVPPLAAQDISPTEGPIDVVAVEGGLVQGVETDVAGVQVFKGIPYAASTAGENRFRPPQPVEPWEGVRLADQWGDQVRQDVALNPVGGFWGDEFYYDPAFMPEAREDGLNLDVFKPARGAGDALPVYDWIHGGGNDHGFASEIEFLGAEARGQGDRRGPGPVPGGRLRQRPARGHRGRPVGRRRQHDDAAQEPAGRGPVPARRRAEHRQRLPPRDLRAPGGARGRERGRAGGDVRPAHEPR